MRLFAGLVVTLAGLSMVPPAAAQVPDVLFKGTVRPILSHGSGAWCAAELGPTLFQRGGAQRALISFPALHYALTGGSAPTYFTLSGQARMNFTTATNGTLKFDEPKVYPDGVLQPEFSQYLETYNAARGSLVVKFRVKFANCNLIVSNTYWD